MKKIKRIRVTWRKNLIRVIFGFRLGVRDGVRDPVTLLIFTLVREGTSEEIIDLQFCYWCMVVLWSGWHRSGDLPCSWWRHLISCFSLFFGNPFFFHRKPTDSSRFFWGEKQERLATNIRHLVWERTNSCTDLQYALVEGRLAGDVRQCLVINMVNHARIRTSEGPLPAGGDGGGVSLPRTPRAGDNRPREQSDNNKEKRNRSTHGGAQEQVWHSPRKGMILKTFIRSTRHKISVTCKPIPHTSNTEQGARVYNGILAKAQNFR